MIILFPIIIWGGQAHYVRIAGNDGNTGHTWATAWATISKVNSTIVSGDTVRFGSGVWYQSTIVPPMGGHSGLQTIYSCSTYTTATRGLTTISAGYPFDSTWTVYSGSIYVDDFSAWGSQGSDIDSRVMTQNDSMLIPKTSTGTMTAGTCFQDYTNDKVYVWLQGSANPNTSLMVMGIAGDVVVDIPSGRTNTNWIKFFGLRLTHGSSWICHVDAASCDSNTFSNCTMAYWGGYSGHNPGAFTSEQSTMDSATYAQHNMLQACSLYCGMNESGFQAHGVATYCQHRFIVDSCVIWGCGNAVYFKDKSAAPQHYGNTVKYSVIFNCNADAHVLWTSAYCRDSVYGNVISGGTSGGIYSESTYSNQYLHGYVFIANNTVHRGKHQGIRFNDDTGDFMGTDNEVKFNIVYACTCTGDQTVMGFFYSTDATQAGYDIDSNMYYLNIHGGNANVWRCSYGGSETDTWASWVSQSRYGFDYYGGVTNVNPGFDSINCHPFNLWAGATRTGASPQMNKTYGGRTWTLFGAVQPDGEPPVLAAIGSKNVDENQNLAFEVSATDEDETIPELTAEDNPSGASFLDNEDGTGDFDWTPSYSQSGVYNVRFIASDGTYADTEIVEITVDNVEPPPNQAPVLAYIGSKNVNEGANLNFNISATDPDLTIPTLTAENKPTNSTFIDNTDGTGIFDFDPDYTQAGMYNVRFIASDGVLADSEIVQITVTEGQPSVDTIRYVFGTAMIEDAGINSTNPNFNYGSSTSFPLDGSAASQVAIFIIRNLTDSLPANITIITDTLYLWPYEGCESEVAGVQVYRSFKTGVVEGTGNGQDVAGVTWNDWSADEYEWGVAGAANASDAGLDNTGDGSDYDRAVTVLGSDNCAGTGDEWLTIPITASLVQSRYDNGPSNDDLVLVLARTQNYPKIISSEYTIDITKRPYFAVRYIGEQPSETSLPPNRVRNLLGGGIVK
jgi:hypothetical protein